MYATVAALVLWPLGQAASSPYDGKRPMELSAPAGAEVPVVGDSTPAKPAKPSGKKAAKDSPPAPAAGGALTPVVPAAADLLAEALALRPSAVASGRPATLASLLTAQGERHSPADVVRAYWRVAEALCAYHFAVDWQSELAALQAGPESRSLLTAGQAGAAAAVSECQLDLLDAQHELAALAGSPPDAPLPLPADRPHTGAYRTSFQELFAGRTAPARARALDQALPLRREVIEARKTAVLAAQEAVTAAQQAHRSGKGDVGLVFSALAELRRQRSAFIGSVCRYNRDILDYAVAVMDSTPGSPPLLAMLLGQAPGSPELRIQNPVRADGSRPIQTVPVDPARPSTRPQYQTPLPQRQESSPGARPAARTSAASGETPQLEPYPMSGGGTVVDPLVQPAAGEVPANSSPPAQSPDPRDVPVIQVPPG